MGFNFKNMFGKIKREKKRIEQPESAQQAFEKVLLSTAHDFFMSMPYSYFLRKGPSYGKK